MRKTHILGSLYLCTLLETRQVKSPVGNLGVAYGKDIMLGKKRQREIYHIPFPHIHFRNLASTNDSISAEVSTA